MEARHGHSKEKYLPETTGPGCAFLDYDNDGWIDITLSTAAPPISSGQPRCATRFSQQSRQNFHRSDPESPRRAGDFGQGVPISGYKRDGFPDFYVTQYGRSILYRNSADGTFTDVTEKAGVAAPGWASSAVWFECDSDGSTRPLRLPFRRFDESKKLPCGEGNKRGYCIPRLYRPTASWLFHDNGDGTFAMSARLRASEIISTRPWAWSPPISTTTAAWICSSPTTRCELPFRQP